jgi:hypothetical protein
MAQSYSVTQHVSDQNWHQVGPFIRVCARGEVDTQVSMDVSGAIQYRVVVDDGPMAAPGVITASSNAGLQTTAFTFLYDAQPFEANDHHYEQLWWRSTTPQGATLHAATMNIQYQEGSLRC